LGQAGIEEGNGKDFLDRPFLEHIAHHDRGLVRYHGDHVQPARLIAQVARAWPELNLTAVTACRDEVYALVRQLRAQGIDAFGFTPRNQPLVETRVAVTTYSGMAYNPVEPEKQDIVIALDAAEATAKHPLWCLGHLDRARLYGLVDMRKYLSRHEDDLVRCLFGFEEVVVPGHGQQHRHVEVLWGQGEGRRLQHDPANNMVSKRYGLWHNETRNRHVARIARAFAAGDKETLAKMFPTKVLSLLPTGPSRIFLLVENVEHALAVMPKLPDWPVIASGLVNLEGLEAQQRADLEGRLVSRMAATSSTLPCAIVTQAGLRTAFMPLKDMDVLLRADGGIGLPALPEAALVHPTTEHGLQPLLVVDVDDSHHPDLQRSARRRQRAYDADGWPPLGQTVAFRRGLEHWKRHLGLHQKGGRQ